MFRFREVILEIRLSVLFFTTRHSVVVVVVNVDTMQALLWTTLTLYPHSKYCSRLGVRV